MARTTFAQGKRYGKAATFKVDFLFLLLSTIAIFLLSGCYPSNSDNIIQSEINPQPETISQNSIVIIQPTDPPAPTVQPEPTVHLIPTQKSVEKYPHCDQASVGQTTSCIIENSYCSYKQSVKGSPTFCNDAPYPSNHFTFLAWGEDLSSYDGKCLIVTGEVTLYQGKPEIIGNGSAISLCDD